MMGLPSLNTQEIPRVLEDFVLGTGEEDQIYISYYITMGFPGGASGKEPACRGRQVPFLGGEDPLN